MKKNKNIVTLVGIVILGLGIGFGISLGKGWVNGVTITDAEVAEELIQSFREVEAVCGKHNVELICHDFTSGCGDIPDGFTCNNWKQALHPEDYDENGRLIREEVMDDWR